MFFNQEDYGKALQKLTVEWARTVLIKLHHAVLDGPPKRKKSQLEKTINEGAKAGKCGSYSLYKNYTSDTLWPDQARRDADHKANIVNFIIHLYETYSLYANYQKPTNSDKPVIITEDELSIRRYEPQSGIMYDCFYWRTEQDQIGVASLLIEQDWSTARMVFHYKKKSKTKTYLSGKVWQDEENVFIQLEDDKERQFPLRVGGRLLVLYASKDKDKRHLMLGCFNGVNRDTHIPVSGMIVLQLSKAQSVEESLYLRDEGLNNNQRKLVDVPEHLSFLLANKRIKVPEQTIQMPHELPLFEQYEQLEGFRGRYEAYFFTFHSSEHNFKSRRMVINGDGTVLSYTQYKSGGKNNKFDLGHMRKYDDVITIQFRYDVGYDTYKYHYYLQTSDSDYLRGIFAGVADSGSITSGKIILKRLADDEDEENVQIRIDQNGLDESIINRLSVPALKFFFGLDGGGAYDHFTDIPLLDYISVHSPEVVETIPKRAKPSNKHPKLTGTFECYCLTKDTDNEFRLPDKNVSLELIPLQIDGDRVKMRFAGKETEGNLFYDGNTWFRIVFPDKLYTFTFTIPTPYSPRSNQLRHVFGVVSSVNLKHPEASAAVLIKTDKDFSQVAYNQFHKIDDLIPLEIQYSGLASFIMGDWNRFIRVPSTSNRDFQPKYATYRRSFWAAACYWGATYQELNGQRANQPEDNDLRKDALWECISNLIRSYRHAFGMADFSSTTEVDANFPKELLQDRKMMRDELSKSLNFSKAKNMVKKLWGIE